MPPPFQRSWPELFTAAEWTGSGGYCEYFFIMIVALSIAVEVTRQWRLTQQRALLVETEKAKAALSFLKGQINEAYFSRRITKINA